MIYKIYGTDLCGAMVGGAEFIIFSFDGTYALVRSIDPIPNHVTAYTETDLQKLYNDPLYKQPCKDC